MVLIRACYFRHPDLPGIDWNNVINQVFLEIYKWQELESFNFYIPWEFGESCLLNVSEIDGSSLINFVEAEFNLLDGYSQVPTALLVLQTLWKFLRRATKSEDEAMQEMLTGFVQSDAAARNYIWWLLTGCEAESMDSVVLGRELGAFVKAYSVSRKILEEKVLKHMNVMRLWGAAYDESMYLY